MGGRRLGFAACCWCCSPRATGFDTGELSALAGAVFLAVAMMSVRWLGSTEPVMRILFYYFLLSTLLSVPVAVLDWQPIPAQAWVWLVALGCAQMFSQVLIVLAYRYASAEKVGPFIYSVIVFTALIDWVVWHHAPTPVTYAGMVLVIGGGLLAVRARPKPVPSNP